MAGLLPEGSRKIARNVGGCALILLGVAGLALPFLQGIALIVAGFLLLEFEGKEAMVERAREHRLGRWLEDRWRRLRPSGKRGGERRS